jgi:hypothetical protein
VQKFHKVSFGKILKNLRKITIFATGSMVTSHSAIGGTIMADNYTMRPAMGARAAQIDEGLRAHYEQSLRHDVRWHADHSIGGMGHRGPCSYN